MIFSLLFCISALFVEGVNVITGDLCLSDELYTVQGKEPIPFYNFYTSRDNTFHDFQHLECTFSPSYGGTNSLCIREHNGIPIIYKPDPSNRNQKPEIGSHFYGNPDKQKNWQDYLYHGQIPPGFSNTFSDKVIPQNQYVLFSCRSDSNGNSFTLYTSDGTKRRYSTLEKDEKARPLYRYKLLSETYPNGNSLNYTWDKNDNITQMYTTSPTGKKLVTISFPPFNPLRPPRSLTFSGSDGRSLTIAANPTAHRFLSPKHPDTCFQTSQDKLTQIIRPSGHIRRIAYNSAGQVEALYGPIGPNDTLEPIYTFSYDPSSRKTTVRDALGFHTIYHWNPDLRLTRIDRTDHSELFVWDQSLLKTKSLLDETGTPLYTTHFSYDGRGNLTEEIFSGNLSGQSNPEEKAIRKTTYSSDGFNLPLRIEDPSGLITLHTYIPHTNLIASTFLSDRQKIQIRYFYEYNQDKILIREIQDDGSSQDPYDYTEVTVRTIKETTPIDSDPYYGLPKIIEEKYWDGIQEVLLKKTSFTYTKGAQISSQEIFDATTELTYTLSYRYNNRGKLLRETNPLGQEAVYRYDELGNQIFAKDFSGTKITMTKYDASDRPTQKIIQGPDGTKNSVTYLYDKTHTLLQETDPLQNTPQITYNAYGKPTLVIYPDGTKEESTYYLNGNLKTTTNPAGVQTLYTYDVFNRVIEKITHFAKEIFQYKGWLLISSTDPEQHTTLYIYDRAGRKIKEEPSDEPPSYSYDPFLNPQE